MSDNGKLNITVVLSRMLKNGGAEIFLRSVAKYLQKTRIKQCICLSEQNMFDKNFAETFPFKVYLGKGEDIESAINENDAILVWGDVKLNERIRKSPKICVFNACATFKDQIDSCNKFVTHVICSSTFARKRMAFGFPNTLIHPGVDPSRLVVKNKELRKKMGFEKNDIVIGTMSRLDSNKRVNWVVEAVKESSQNVKALIVGEGPEYERIKSMASKKIVMVGHQEDVADYYNCMDVFCMVSESEGCSASLFEAMFMKLAPIVTNVGSVPDIINQDNGIVIQNKNDLFLAIKKLQDETIRKKIAEKAYITANGIGHISKTAARWDNLFLKLARGYKWKLHL